MTGTNTVVVVELDDDVDELDVLDGSNTVEVVAFGSTLDVGSNGLELVGAAPGSATERPSLGGVVTKPPLVCAGCTTEGPEADGAGDGTVEVVAAVGGGGSPPVIGGMESGAEVDGAIGNGSLVVDPNGSELWA